MRRCTGKERCDEIWTRFWVGGHYNNHIIDLSTGLINVQLGLALLLNQHIMFDFVVM